MTLMRGTRLCFPGIARALAVGAVLAVAACETTDLTSEGAAEKPAASAQDMAAVLPEVSYEPIEDMEPVPGTATDPNALQRIALLVPLSGNAAQTGEALLNAAQMAVFDVADDRLVLQPYDTAGTPEGAQGAAALALAQGARLMIGPLFASSAQEVAPQARAGGVNMITFSTDASVAGDGVYVVGFLLREQVRRVVEHARAQGMQRFAALAPDSNFGRLMVDAYTDAVRRMGGTVTRVETYDPNDTSNLAGVVQRLGDYDQRRAELLRQRAELEARDDAASSAALRRLEALETIGELPFDALLLPEAGNAVREVAAMLPYYDIDTSQVKLLGPMLWSDPALAREPAMVGAWYPAPPPESHADFERRYQRAFGERPPVIAALAYDTTALAAVLARSGGPAPFSQETLTNPSGFAGYDGLFRFRTDGTSERGFAVMEIRPGGNVLVGPAPESFDPGPLASPGYTEEPRPAF